jgi:predicted ferric reductase
MYRLHKWLGITALVVSVSHWLIAKGPKWAVGLGWLERGARPRRPVLPEGSLQQVLANQRGLAESVAEWAFYIAVVLMVLALIKYFPYRRFFQTHRILAITYLALVFHTVVLVKFAYWATPVGVVLIPLLVLGSVSAVLCLLRKRLGGKRVTGQIQALDWQSGMQCLAVTIKANAGWPGHEAGQFAFVTFHADEGAHPFTMASAWAEEGTIRFIIKALGDYTKALPERLKVGDQVTLEGPYGQFNFDGERRRQIWISGGIGITPFIARMQARSQSPDALSVDLFHCSTDMTPEVLQRLESDARNAKVNLHLFVGKRFEVADLFSKVKDWKAADIWFCGPAQFGQSVFDKLNRLGMPAEQFHRELFEMR